MSPWLYLLTRDDGGVRTAMRVRHGEMWRKNLEPLDELFRWDINNPDVMEQWDRVAEAWTPVPDMDPEPEPGRGK